MPRISPLFSNRNPFAPIGLRLDVSTLKLDIPFTVELTHEIAEPLSQRQVKLPNNLPLIKRFKRTNGRQPIVFTY